MVEETGLTPQEEAELQQYLTANAPQPEEKHNVHKFLHEVSTSDDTTKTGFLTEEELGAPHHSVRSLKDLALFCEDIGGMPQFAEHFRKSAEIVTSTSLSKKAKLLELAVVSKRQLEDVTKTKEKGGLFGKKKKEEQ